MKIKRILQQDLIQSIHEVPITAVLGPRQCGKTTLLTMFRQEYPSILHLDMEYPDDLRAMQDAAAFFSMHRDRLICIDEIQRVPEIYQIIRYDVDTLDKNGRFIVLGSASPALLQQTSETLAGRIRYLELTPFLLNEVNTAPTDFRTLMLRGGYPRSFLAASDEASVRWRVDFINTFLERDIPNLGFKISATHMNRFWTMLSHVNGSIFNHSKFGESLGISYHTVQSHLDILIDTYMIRMLMPLSANLKKRIVKSPKIIFRDTGILNALLNIQTQQQLMSHPDYGGCWEAFVIEQILSFPKIVNQRWNSYFYRSHQGEEIDLVLDTGSKLIAIECKVSSAPEVPKGFYRALSDLSISEAWIIAPVERMRLVGGIIKIGRIQDFYETL